MNECTLNDKLRDTGLLILRVGIGLMFVGHGLPKVLGGPAAWNQVGGALPVAGPALFHTFMGFLAAMSEFGGGILLALGLFTRIAAFFMFFTMAVAFSMHLRHGDDFNTFSHAVEAGILFFSMMFIGAGRLSLDAVLSRYCPCRKILKIGTPSVSKESVHA